MSCYLLKYVNTHISIAEYEDEDDKFIPLSKKGEESWHYDSSFWEWFKKKIEYDDEELSFIIVTDKQDFSIPASSQITLSQTSGFDNYTSTNRKIMPISNDLFVLSYPERRVVESLVKEEVTETINLEEYVNNNGLMNHFRNKTRSYKNE